MSSGKTPKNLTSGAEKSEFLIKLAADPAYAPNVRRMISIVFDDVPRIPLWQPSLNSAVIKGLEGYQYWFYRGVDARSLTIS